MSNVCKEVKSFCLQREDLTAHFEYAYKGILEPVKKIFKRPLRPMLNTSDLYELDFL